MATKISRRKLAAYIADRLADGGDKKQLLRELAAYLVANGRAREAELVVRDIEKALTSRGTAIATVVSARPLTDSAKSTIRGQVEAAYDAVKHVVLKEVVDESVIGGVRLELPDKQYDGTIKSKLDNLTA